MARSMSKITGTRDTRDEGSDVRDVTPDLRDEIGNTLSRNANSQFIQYAITNSRWRIR